MISSKVFLGAIAGMALGAAAALLLAPKSGSDTRKQIMKSGKDYVDSMKHRFDEYADLAGKKFVEAEKELESMVHMGKAKYDGVKNDIKNS